MPRTLVCALSSLVALALAAPVAASTAHGAAGAGAGVPVPGQTTNGGTSTAPGQSPALAEGTLTVQAANGVLVLSGRGSVLGQVVGRGRVMIEDADPADGVPVVSGFERAQRHGRFGVLYLGSNLRFRVLSGVFKLRVVGSGISLSFVGRGTASLVPAGTLDDGSYSLDGGETYRPLAFGATTNLVVGAVPGVQPQGVAIGRPQGFR